MNITPEMIINQKPIKKINVYCKNCKWFQAKFSYPFASMGIFARTDCNAPQNRTEEYSPSEIIKKIKQNHWDINKNNDCPYYKRIWYKFWWKKVKSHCKFWK